MGPCEGVGARLRSDKTRRAGTQPVVKQRSNSGQVLRQTAVKRRFNRADQYRGHTAVVFGPEFGQIAADMRAGVAVESESNRRRRLACLVTRAGLARIHGEGAIKYHSETVLVIDRWPERGSRVVKLVWPKA